MKRIILTIIFVMTGILFANATHIIGGEMRYEYVGPGVAPNSKQYRIRLILLRGPTGAVFINQYVVGVFNKDNGLKVPGTANNNNWAAVEDFVTPLAVPINVSPCISLPPSLNYTYKTYSFLIELPNNNLGYTVAFQTYSRQNSQNVVIDEGANYLCEIPGLSKVPAPQTDNCPAFKLPIAVICANSNFNLDFSATDADGDSLSYAFCNAYDGGAAAAADYRDPQPPPYNAITYVFPFNGTNPLGRSASINPVTGIISGLAPNGGKYVVCVCISVYRNGLLIGSHRKDLIVEVSGCIPTEAIAMPSLTTCDGFNIQFSHSSTGANTVFWDFGDPSTPGDTSVLDAPTYTYADTGLYTIKFVINRGGNCTDSTTRTIGVYPGFFPGFDVDAPFCAGVPVQFNDTSATNYGTINSWSWNFGDASTLGDTSHLKNPSYAYPAAGTYQAQFKVSNSKGCTQTITRDIVVLEPPAITAISSDSTYCGLDSLQLALAGAGNVTWSPAINILNANTAVATVFPTVATTYIATLESQGCRSLDSVRVIPKFDLSNAISASPGTICEEDSLILTGSSNKTDHLQWAWSPTVSVLHASLQSTVAFPAATTTYSLLTRWGKNCVVTSTVNVPVTRLAIPNAGKDTAFCASQSAIQLAATGGTTYQWSPAAGLSATNLPNPTASPAATTQYIVAVGVTGCTRTRTDTVVVTVRTKPSISLTNDTLICTIDTLQLQNLSGPGNVVWSPNYMISSTTSNSPLVSPDLPTKYYMRYTDAFGCYNDDSVFVDVKPAVTLDAGADTSICASEGFVLSATGDALHYTWTSARYLSDSSIQRPFATPPVTTVFTVIGNIGKCQAQSDVKVTVAPYPPAFAGRDTSICVGKNVTLTATGGSRYSWSPGTFLNATNIASPTALNPRGNTRYIVTVTDTLGCPKAMSDTVLLSVVPALNVNAGPADTSIVDGELLFLNATGADTYLWTPGTRLSSTTIANPVANPTDSIRYFVTGTDRNGCMGYDSINVRVFRVDPDMYVPTAFTPNGDGNNDLARPILLGMKSLNYFRIYNRMGELVFATSEVGKGWNGIYKGKPQDLGTFVWMAEGRTYKGELRKKKGYLVLIR